MNNMQSPEEQEPKVSNAMTPPERGSEKKDHFGLKFTAAALGAVAFFAGAVHLVENKRQDEIAYMQAGEQARQSLEARQDKAAELTLKSGQVVSVPILPYTKREIEIAEGNAEDAGRNSTFTKPSLRTLPNDFRYRSGGIGVPGINVAGGGGRPPISIPGGEGSSGEQGDAVQRIQVGVFDTRKDAENATVQVSTATELPGGIMATLNAEPNSVDHYKTSLYLNLVQQGGPRPGTPGEHDVQIVVDVDR